MSSCDCCSQSTILQVRASRVKVSTGAAEAGIWIYWDYVIRFSSCAEVQGYFDHVATLSGDLIAALQAASGECSTYTAGADTYEQCRNSVSIPVAAGAQIGTAGGPSTLSAALDFGMRDARIPALVYANPARNYASENGFDLFHVVCAIDYYSAEIKSLLEAKLNRSGGVPPICGEVAQDVIGAAKGKWYVPGTPSPTNEESTHLALVAGNIDASLRVISVGNTTVGQGEYFFVPQNTGLVNRTFAEVTNDGMTYCYDSLQDRLGGTVSNTVFLIEMINASTIKIESQSQAACGAGPWLFGSPVSFER